MAAASRSCRHLCNGALQTCRNASALATAAGKFRPTALTACYAGSAPQFDAKGAAPSSANEPSGNWSEVRGQAATVFAWPSHPLVAEEKLALAESLIHRAEDLEIGNSASCGIAICDAYRELVQEEGLLGVRSEGTAYCSVIRVSSAAFLSDAVREAVVLLLRGHAVSLAASDSTLTALESLTSEFPPALLQAVQDGPMEALPTRVRSIRTMGFRAKDLWSEQVPPQDFGGLAQDGFRHGMLNTAAPLALARTNIAMLAQKPRSRYALSDEANDLAALLSTTPAADSPTIPGLPPPRWARSAYDRGLEEVHDFLDLLWAFHKPCTISTDIRTMEKSIVGLAPARKHFVFSSETDLPEDVIKTAIVSALSPYYEPVTLHCVGLGPRGLSRDPLRGFCRLVQSGKSGLQWSIKEHESWQSFHRWLHHVNAENPGEAPMIFSTARGSDRELQQNCAASGGVAWGSLFVSEPLEQLRRWTRVVTADSSDAKDVFPEARAHVEVEVVRPLQEDDH